jgi:hypothetical protein
MKEVFPMGNMASLLLKEGVLAGEVAVIRGRERRRIEDGRLSFAVLRAFGLYEEIKALEAELSEARKVIRERAKAYAGQRATVSFEASGVICRVTERHEVTVPEENVQELRRLLGRRFKDLVSVRRKYLGTRRLVEEAASNGDIQGLLVLRELTPQLSFFKR